MYPGLPRRSVSLHGSANRHKNFILPDPMGCTHRADFQPTASAVAGPNQCAGHARRLHGNRHAGKLGNNPVVVVTINACDSTWNIVPVSGDSIYLTNSASSVPLGVLPNAASLVNGTVQQAMAFQTQGSWTINAVDSSNTNIPPATSSSISVGP